MGGREGGREGGRGRERGREREKEGEAYLLIFWQAERADSQLYSAENRITFRTQ